MPNRREKSEALIMDRELQSYLMRTIAETSLISLRIFAAVRRAFIRGTDIGVAFHDEYMKTAPRLAELMLVGALLGIRRASVRAIGQDWSLSRSLWKETVSQHKLLMKIPVKTLREMKKQLGAQALAMTQHGSAVIERRLQKRVQTILDKDLHVKDGIKALAKEFDELGLTPSHKAHLETLYRTQTHLAYAAGREVQEMDPDIDEILWGYRYITVGDDRVRASHAGLDGVALPKGDPFWATNKPPNGWNCRCQAVPLFDPPEGGSVRPPDLFEDVKPGADKGFGFRASDIFDLRRPGSVASGGLTVPPVPPNVLRRAVTVTGKHTSARTVRDIQRQTAVVDRLARVKTKTATGLPRKGLLVKRQTARDTLSDLKLKLKGRPPAVRTRSVPVADIGRVKPVAVRKTTGSPVGPSIAPKPVTVPAQPSVSDWKKGKTLAERKIEFQEVAGIQDVTVVGQVELRVVETMGDDVLRLRQSYPKLNKIVSDNPLSRVEIRASRYVSEGTSSGVYSPKVKRIRIETGNRLNVSQKGWEPGGFSTEKNVSSVWRHEYGHHMRRTLGSSKEFDAIYNAQSRVYWEKRVTKYAATNSSELYAESFTVYTNPSYGLKGARLPKRIEEFFEKALGAKNPNLAKLVPVSEVPATKVIVKLRSELAALEKEVVEKVSRSPKIGQLKGRLSELDKRIEKLRRRLSARRT